MLPGKLLLSLPPALAPLPIPGPRLQAFRIRSHREGKFFIGVMKPSSTPSPNSVDSVQGGPKSPSRFPTLSLSLAPPLSKLVGESWKQDVWWRISR